MLAKPAIAVAITLAAGLAGPGPVPSANAAMMPAPIGASLDAAVTPSATATKLTAYSESSTRIRYSGSWSYAYGSGYLGSRIKVSRTKGASADFAFTGLAVAWYGPVGPTRGQARVYLNGTYVKTVSMYARSFVARKALYVATFPTQRSGHVKIVVVGTSGRPTVAIDTFTVRSLAPVASTTGYPANTTLAALATPSMSQPGYLVAARDPLLGTQTTRVTSTAGVRHSYARLSAWNSDGTKILLGFSYPGRMLDGRTYRDLGAFRQVSQAIWSNVDRNKLYGAIGNAVYRQNATTGALTKLRTFTGYSSISIGNYEGGISDDDRWMALIGTTSTGAKHLITYNVAANSIYAHVAIPSGINNAQISRKGNYVVVVNNADGTARGRGVERYTRSLASRINLTPYGRHGDNALDAAGNEIYVSNNAPYVTAFRLSNGSAKRLLSGTTAFEYGHVSGRNIRRPGWVYLSVFDNSITAGRRGHDQVIAVKTDGSGTVEVFAFSHHGNTTTYATQPQAVPSPDGRRVLFASEWGTSSVYAFIAAR